MDSVHELKCGPQTTHRVVSAPLGGHCRPYLAFFFRQVDARHFSLSHQGGQTAQIFHGVDGTLHPGPRTDFNIWSWGLEPVNPIQFGDRFIQFGAWAV